MDVAQNPEPTGGDSGESGAGALWDVFIFRNVDKIFNATVSSFSSLLTVFLKPDLLIQSFQTFPYF